jgi:hypothetical protein
MYLSLLPGIFIMITFLTPEEPGAGMIVFPIWFFVVLFFFVLGNVIHFLISLFTKHKVYIDEESITIQGKKIVTQSMKFKDVKNVVFDHGTIGKVSSTPCSITLFDHYYYSNSLVIENPSFFMICELQKRCKNAKFKFNNYKWYIIWCCISTAASIAFCLFIHLAPTYS